MQINAYLSFPGTCEEALNAYADILGGEISYIMRFGESPMAEDFPDIADKIMHANLTIGEAQIMASDSPPDQYQRPQGISVCIAFPDSSRAKAAFDRLAEGGEVHMAFGKTFWAEGFGVLTDRFGIPWMIDCADDAPQ